MKICVHDDKGKICVHLVTGSMRENIASVKRGFHKVLFERVLYKIDTSRPDGNGLNGTS